MQLLNKLKDKIPADAIYIGRGSPLGNPFVIGVDGDRDEVVHKYRGWLTKAIQRGDPDVMGALAGLKEDSKIVCYCAPQACHGDVVQELWAKYRDEKPENEDGFIPIDVVYRKWLLHKMISGNAETIRDFREREYTEHSLPERFRSKESSKVFIELYDEINQCGTFEEGLTAALNKYMENRYYSPNTDGIDHINIYSKGNTRLGRMLSNFAPLGFIHPTLGIFRSVEAFWYYTSRINPPEYLRELYGFEAKKLGRSLPKKEDLTPEKHAELVKQAIQCKIYQNEDLKARLIACDLPLAHYYVFGSGPGAIIREDERFKWIAQYILEVRAKLIKQKTEFKVILAGSRTFDNPKRGDIGLLDAAYRDSGFKATQIVSGGARGPDKFAITHIAPKYGIPYIVKEANWDEFGKRAGILRNIEMGDYADALVVLWDGKSSGTRHMVEYMLSLGKPVYVSEFPF